MKSKWVLYAFLIGLGLLNGHFTADAQPLVTTLPATSITATNATLNGTVNPNGGVTTVYYQYGLTTNYGYMGGYMVLPSTNNAAITLPGLVADAPSAGGANWTQTSAGSASYLSLASSADGTKLAAGNTAGEYGYYGVLISTDSGLTWSQPPFVPPSGFWSSIAYSADGTRLAVVNRSSVIYVSTDGGASANANTQTGASAIACSADGMRMAAAGAGGVWTSTDGGITFTKTSGPTGCTAIGCSADGTRLAAGVSIGGIWTSTNSGATWTQTSAPSNQSWESIASSADGMRLVAGSEPYGNGTITTGGGIWTSTDGGMTWTSANVGGGAADVVASSADGLRLAAAGSVPGAPLGAIYTSTDGGVNWNGTSAADIPWNAIASSADGTKLVAAPYGGGIYTSTGATNGLAPGTTYHYRVVAINSAGSTVGSDLTFTTGPSAPTVTTLPANEINSSNIMTPIALTGFNRDLVIENTAVALETLYSSYAQEFNPGEGTCYYQQGLPGTAYGLPASGTFNSVIDGTLFQFQPYTASNALVLSSDTAISSGTLRLVTPARYEYIAILANSAGAPPSTVETVTIHFADGSSYTTGYDAADWFSNPGFALQGVERIDIRTDALSGGPSDPRFYQTTLNLDAILGANNRPIASLTFTEQYGAGATGIYAVSGNAPSPTNATLCGAVNPNGAATAVYFQYGLTTSYGSYTTTNTLAATNVILSVYDLISNLTPNTTYHFQLVASNSIGLSRGGDLTFTTPPVPPIVTTLPATSIASTSATLTGSVNPNGAAGWVYFQYGLSTNYGNYSATNTVTAANSAVAVFNVISNLAPGTIYHCQLLAGNAGGISSGNDVTFTNSPGAPTVGAISASGITGTNATLNGSVLTGDLTTSVYFQYGLNPGYGSYSATTTLGGSQTLGIVSNLVSNLLPGNTYYFQLVASNSAGSAESTEFSITTPPLPPLATTLPATSVTSSNATLHSTVNPEGSAAGAYFQYGLTTNYDYRGGFVMLPATDTASNQDLTIDLLNGPAGTNWTPTGATNTYWNSIASSADGLRLAAVSGVETHTCSLCSSTSGGIYTSTNGGVTWTQTSAPNDYWESIASSADGTQLAAGIYGGGLYTSTDGGSTWAQTSAPSGDVWSSIASSADGTHLAATDYDAYGGGGIYTSTDGGSTWRNSSPITAGWSSVACSADGTRLAAVASINEDDVYSFGYVFTSTNGGGTWTLTTQTTPSGGFIASSADGMKLALAATFIDEGRLTPFNFVPGYVYTSPDGGATWTQTSAPNAYWSSITSSADGTRLAAVELGGGIYTSTDSGVTWAQSSAPSANWQAIASSATGTTMAAVVGFGGGIYTSEGPTNSLAPGTTYHYGEVAYNSAGISYGNDLTFTTGPAAPTATTLAATSISANNAALNGSVNPNGAATTAYYEYGTDTNYGSYSAAIALVATNSTLSASSLISSLVPGTTYHFQLVASNSVGTSVGGDVTFTTPPAVITLAATGITATNATLNGSINPGGDAAAAYFQYGLTTNYGSFSVIYSLSATNAMLSVSDLIASLTPGTTYHYQLVGTNAAGASLGGDVTFTTSPAAPTVTTFPASGVTPTSATLNVSVNPNGAATAAYFRYGFGTNVLNSATNSLVGTNTTLLASNLVSNLAPGTLYAFQPVAINSVGTVFGADLFFTTSPGHPEGTTLPASGVTASQATLNGELTTGGLNTSVYFRYGLTAAYGLSSATNILAGTNLVRSVSSLIAGLSLGTVYHFELVATNAAGTVVGGDRTFTTPSAPTVTTLAASGVTASSATLNGNVNPNGAATTAYFQYGTDTNYGSFSATNILAATNATLSVSNLIASLTPGTTYHFRLVATNTLGTSLGADHTFTTGSSQPVAFNVNGSVQSSGGAFQLSFTNLSGLSFSVLGSTNAALPLSNWTALGPAVESPAGSGNYQFTDPQATNNPIQFYRVRSP